MHLVCNKLSTFSFQKSLQQSGISYVIKIFLSPSLLILCLAGSIRNAGGYVWAYNTQPYFDKYYPNVNLGYWMSWIPLVGGSMGVLLGGIISDQVIKNRGLYARVWVLVFSQVRVIPGNLPGGVVKVFWF